MGYNLYVKKPHIFYRVSLATCNIFKTSETSKYYYIQHTINPIKLYFITILLFGDMMVIFPTFCMKEMLGKERVLLMY